LRKKIKKIESTRARSLAKHATTTTTTTENTHMSTKFLGGMRGLTKFVEKIRNCANQVRARQSMCIYIRFFLGPRMKREREPSEIFVQISRPSFFFVRAFERSPSSFSGASVSLLFFLDVRVFLCSLALFSFCVESPH